MRTALLTALLTFTSCTCAQLANGGGTAPGAKTDTLAQDMKRVLAERDRRLSSYHVQVETHEGTSTAHHEFYFRSPNQSRGIIIDPTPLTLSFDGHALFKLTPGEKKLERFELKLPVEKASFFLLTQFAPFVPEGYRTPLLPSKGVTAVKTTDPHAPDAVSLTVVTPDGSGGQVTTQWVLRAISGDFLSKTVTSSAGTRVTRVDSEKCDEVAKLCVPASISELENGQPVATMTMTTIELNAAVPNDAFTLTAPEGFTTENHTVEEEAPGAPK